MNIIYLTEGNNGLKFCDLCLVFSIQDIVIMCQTLEKLFVNKLEGMPSEVSIS